MALWSYKIIPISIQYKEITYVNKSKETGNKLFTKPMLKKYTELAQTKELKMGPKNETLNAILNYSKSIKVNKVKGEKMMINLN